MEVLVAVRCYDRSTIRERPGAILRVRWPGGRSPANSRPPSTRRSSIAALGAGQKQWIGANGGPPLTGPVPADELLGGDAEDVAGACDEGFRLDEVQSLPDEGRDQHPP